MPLKTIDRLFSIYICIVYLPVKTVETSTKSNRSPTDVPISVMNRNKKTNFLDISKSILVDN